MFKDRIDLERPEALLLDRLDADNGDRKDDESMSAELLGDMKDSALSSVGIDDRKDDELNSVELSWLAEFKVSKES